MSNYHATGPEFGQTNYLTRSYKPIATFSQYWGCARVSTDSQNGRGNKLYV